MSDEAKPYTNEDARWWPESRNSYDCVAVDYGRLVATVRALEAERAAHEKAERERDEARARVAQLEEALRQSNKYIDEAVARRLEWFEAQQRRFGIGSAEAKAASKSAHDVVNSTRNSFDSVARALSTSPFDWIKERDAAKDARIAQLEEAGNELRDELNEACDDTDKNAIEALNQWRHVLSASPSDWLAEHDRSIAERQREACAKWLGETFVAADDMDRDDLDAAEVILATPLVAK